MIPTPNFVTAHLGHAGAQMKELDRLRKIRNAVMHSQPDSVNLIMPEIVEALREYTGTLRRYHGPS